MWPNGPRVDGHRESSRLGSAAKSRPGQPRHAPCAHQHGDRAGHFAAWPTRSPSRGTRGGLELGIEMETPTETPSTRTPASISTRTVLATLQRGRLGPRVEGHREDSSSASRCRPRPKPSRRAPRLHQHADRAGYFGRLGPRVDGHREDSSSASRCRPRLKPPQRAPRVHTAKWPTWSPSRWTQGRLQFGIETKTPTETSSTRTPRPHCRVADSVPESMDTGKTPVRHRDEDPDRNLLDAHPASRLQSGRLGPRVDGHREDASSASRCRPRPKPPQRAPRVHPAEWPTRSPSRWTQGRPQLGIETKTPTETSSTRTPRPSARGPCGLLWA